MTQEWKMIYDSTRWYWSLDGTGGQMEFSLVERECLFWATRSKLHVALLIWWWLYFCWIPLLERCKIDLKIILFGWAEHIFWFCFPHMCKVGQICNVGLQAQKMCHTPSLMDINWRDLMLICSSTHHTFSSCDLIGSISLWRPLSHTSGSEAEGVRTVLGLFAGALTSVDCGSNLGVLTSNLCRKSDLLRPH